MPAQKMARSRVTPARITPGRICAGIRWSLKMPRPAAKIPKAIPACRNQARPSWNQEAAVITSGE